MTTLALIGKGRWGKNYINTIHNLSACELPDEFVKGSDYKDLLSKKNIDGVIIATPCSTHFKIAKEFLEKGFNVLIEKPLTVNIRDATKLYKIADKSKGVVMVGHLYLYNPAFLEVKKLFKSIGKIQFISTEGMNYGPIRNDASSLWDWGPHDVSMAMDMLGSLPQEVSAYGLNALRPDTTLYDMCNLKLKFPNNIFVFVNIGWLSPIKKRNVFIKGEDGTIIFDDTVDKKVTYIKNLDKDRETSYPTFSGQSPLSAQISEFIKRLESKEKIDNSSLKMGLNVVKVLDACERSIKLNGKSIKIK